MANLSLGKPTTQEVSDVATLKTLNIRAGNYVKTVSYNADYLTVDAVIEGGALYRIDTLTNIRVMLANPSWNPDGVVHFLLDNGNVAFEQSQSNILESYTSAQISSSTSTLNLYRKVKGKMILDTTNSKMKISLGDDPTANWVDADGSNPVNPA